MPKVPQKPPQFFIELDKGKVINPDNKDINPILNQISVKSLINWKKDTNIELIMDEIYDSFLKIYPICKTTLNPCSKGKLSQIKSVYILKRMISFMEESQKLKLFQYNKIIQEILNINILNYKVLSGKYKVGGKNGLNMIFNGNDNTLLFKGEYKNGKKNGKGIEYYSDGRLLFKGEYKINKRNGKGKEYNYYTGEVIFKGEYLNGYKWQGKGYDINMNIICEINNGNGYLKIYDGYTEKKLICEYEFKNGKKHGKAKEYNRNPYYLIFEGEYLNDKRKKGIEYNKEGNLIFEGEYLNGKKWNGCFCLPDESKIKNGKGKIKEEEFEGEYINGEKNGKGKEYYYSKDEENSECNLDSKLESVRNIYYNDLHGCKNNCSFESENNSEKENEEEIEMEEIKEMEGIKEIEVEKENEVEKEEFMETSNKIKKLKFEGEYLNGKRHGKGKEYYSNGKYFKGEYLYGHKIKGKEYNNNKLFFEGEYLYDNKWNGKGYDLYNNSTFTFSNGNANGIIKDYYSNGRLKFEGEYLNGKGKGKEYFNMDEEHVKVEGEYLNEKRNGKGKEYDLVERSYAKQMKYFFETKRIFEGEYLNDKRWNGKIFNEDGDVIDIIKKEMIRYNRDEAGELKFEDKYISNKKYKKGEFRKYKKEFDKNGLLIFEGEFVNEVKNGKGKAYSYFKGVVYMEVGNYINGKKYGIFKEYYDDKLVKEIEYKNGLENGICKEYDNKRNLLFEGFIESKNCIKKTKIGKKYNSKGNFFSEVKDIFFYDNSNN